MYIQMEEHICSPAWNERKNRTIKISLTWKEKKIWLKSFYWIQIYFDWIKIYFNIMKKSEKPTLISWKKNWYNKNKFY